MAGEPRWERVAAASDRRHADILERIPVDGGWLYRSRIYDGNSGSDNLGLAFVPAPSSTMEG